MLFFFISAGNAEPSRDEAALESFVAAAHGDTKQGTVWGKIRELKQINVSGEKPVINEQGLNKHEEYELASIPGGWGGGGGTRQSLIRGGSAPRSKPLPFYIQWNPALRTPA